MSFNERIYYLGQTLVAAPTGSTAIAIIPPRTCQSITFKYQSGGTLAIVNSQTAAFATGYVCGTTEVVSLNGPAQFFLVSSGATSVVGVLFGYSAGFSALP